MSAWTERLHEPTLHLDPSGLDELELLLGGLYGPNPAYSLPGDDSPATPVEIHLDVPAATAESAEAGGALLLTDTDGTPLARLSTTALSRASDGRVYLAGPVEPLQPAEHSPGRAVRITGPLNSSDAKNRPVLMAAYSRVPHSDEISSAVLQAQADNASLWLVAVAPAADDRGLFDLLNELQRCERALDNTYAGLLVIPHYTAPIRNREQTRGQYALDRLGADKVLDFTHAEDLDGSASAGHLNRKNTGLVVLFTGLSGSGKSTLARALSEHLQRADDREVSLLDGDDVRRFLTAGLGFSREDRNTNVERIGWVAALVAKTGGIAICAPIAPFEESRQRVRELAQAAGQYVLVHVSTPLEECEKRDRKGLYAKARAGLIPDFTGIDSPYDVPLDADYVVDTSVTSVEETIDDLTRIMSNAHV